MSKRIPFTYGVTVHLMRRDAAGTQSVQMGNTVLATDADEAKEVALVECAFSASEHFPAWKVMKYDVYNIRQASDAAWA